MIFNFSPIRMDEVLKVSILGDSITLNGETFDFSPLEAGDTLPKEAIASKWFCGDVFKDDSGVLNISLLLPHGGNAPKETRYPNRLVVDEDGEVVLPAYSEEIVNG